MKLPPYPKYKDSGVPWLGDIPEHWEVRRLRNLGTFLKGFGGTKADETATGVPCVRYGDLYTQHDLFIEKTRACIPAERGEAYAPIHIGDVLFAGSGETLEEIGKSAVSLLPDPAYCGGDVIIFRPSVELDAKFLGSATGCRHATLQKACMGRGITVMHIYSNELKHLSIALPPLPEQIAIAQYLDEVDQRVQQATQAAQKLIDLLTQQRQAIIHRAVTRGLNPDVPLKPSGVPWLGDIPEHWEIRRLKHWLQINQKTLSEGTDPNYEFDYLDIGAVEAGQLITDLERIEFSEAPSRARRVVSQGDTVVSTVRTYLKAVWHAANPTENLIASTGFAVLSPLPNTSPAFVGYLVQSDTFTNRVTAESTGIAYPSITETRLGNLEVGIPPLPEQTTIAEYLNQATADISAAIDRAEREVELLKEYCTRLIADVVTGKLDVRKAAAELPVTPLAEENERGQGLD